MNNKDLIKMLHHTAVAANERLKEEAARREDELKTLTVDEMAKIFVSNALNDDSLLLAANKGAFTISVLPIMYWIEEEKFDALQAAVWKEIIAQGFEPQIISELVTIGEDRMDYYIGIQWRKI